MKEFVKLTEVSPKYKSSFFCAAKLDGIATTDLFLRRSEICSIESVTTWWNSTPASRITMHNKRQFYVTESAEEIIS
jgi:hypothetical protein